MRSSSGAEVNICGHSKNPLAATGLLTLTIGLTAEIPGGISKDKIMSVI